MKVRVCIAVKGRLLLFLGGVWHKTVPKRQSTGIFWADHQGGICNPTLSNIAQGKVRHGKHRLPRNWIGCGELDKWKGEDTERGERGEDREREKRGRKDECEFVIMR